MPLLIRLFVGRKVLIDCDKSACEKPEECLGLSCRLFYTIYRIPYGYSFCKTDDYTAYRDERRTLGKHKVMTSLKKEKASV